MLRNKLILLSVVFLSACQTTQPGIKTVVQKVEVPVATPCKEVIPPAPAFNFDKLQPSNDIFVQVQVLDADRLLHQGYEEQLLAALNACVK